VSGTTRATVSGSRCSCGPLRWGGPEQGELLRGAGSGYDVPAAWTGDHAATQTALVHHDEFDIGPHWHRTGDHYSPVAATVDGHWWVLRLNNFPDHPLLTLFIDCMRQFDVDDIPPAWGNPVDRANPSLESRAAEEALAPISTFVAYGSEVGQACDNMFCCGS
jgi:hypothetical protein